MNLLNKKIKDKLKVLEDIDRQYIINITNENSNKRNNSKINTNNTNSIDRIKRTNQEKFDKIYSNFFFDENTYLYNEGERPNKKIYFISNNNFENPTKEDSIEKEKNNDSYIQKESMKTLNNETKIQNYTGIEGADRLNNNSIFIENGIKNQKSIQDNKIKRFMSPTISSRSGSNVKIIKKTNEKSYPNHKNNTTKKNKDNSMNIKSNNITGNRTKFTYHQKLNKNSTLSAKKLESNFIGLNKRKKVNYKNSENKKMKVLNLYGGSLINNNKKKKNIKYSLSLINNNSNKKNKYNINILEKMNNLYLRGIEEKQKKANLYKENQKKKEEEYKNFSFKPKINKNSSMYNINNNDFIYNKKKNNSKKEKNNIYKKNFEWKKRIEKKINKKKEKKEEIMNIVCTFKPDIIEYNYHNNEKNLSKVLEQMNEYILKRRKNIKYKKDEEEYKYKRIYGSGNKYIVKSTIPQEFELETEIRNRDMNKNKNRSCDNFHIKKNNLLLDQFSDKKSINYANNQKYWFFKENMNNCYSHNNTRTNNKYNETLSQIDFIEAVSLLHDKLDKLNI